MRRTLNLGRRASVAVWIAVMAPGLIMATSLGVEAASWAAAKVAVQRAADVSAVAGAINYLATSNQQTATTFAARMAQLNGASGTTTPTWNSTTHTLTDNMISAAIVPGYTGSGTALQVTVQKSIAATMSKVFSSTGTYTVTGIGTAQLITTVGAGSGGQPCLLALAGGVTGVTSGNDITETGSGSTTATNCTIRSNTGVKLSGSGSMTAQGVYAGGAISQTGSGSITGTQYPSDGQIPDPYAGNTTLQTALTSANGATGSGAINCSGSGGSGACTGPSGSFSCGATVCTLQPGTYTSLSATGSVGITLNSGLYVFTGNVSVTGSGSVSGSSITILMAAGTGTGNKLSITGSGSVSLSAATTAGATGGQIPGILFASLTTSTLGGLNGSGSAPFVGVTYLPNAAMSYTGSGSSGSAGCQQLIAKTISLTGSGSFDATSCSPYGTAAFTSVAGTSTTTARVVR